MAFLSIPSDFNKNQAGSYNLYQMTPFWPTALKKRMLGFHLHYDHGDVYNFAKEWFRIKSSPTDSIIMQRLQVNKKEIANDIRSDVNLTFYSEN